MNVKSFIEFWQKIREIDVADDEMLFFRGHSDKNYLLTPSALREGNLRRENEFYHNIMVEYPEQFKKNEHLSNLVKMQHYGCMTRLLDLTTNPLIALYFASECNANTDGQVICFKVKKSAVLHHTSDKALMLSCLPSFTEEEKREIFEFCSTNKTEISDNAVKSSRIMRRFLHEIRSENPAFETCIIGDDLLKAYFVKTYKDNERVKIQSGAFIIFGLGNTNISEIENSAIKIDISGSAKQEILKDLEMVEISNATVYPDFERRAMQLARRKVSWVDIGK